jgi:hypothetical protein
VARVDTQRRLEMAVELRQHRSRRPGTVAILGAGTLGLYSVGWYYKINRERRHFGAARGDRELSATRPWVSALAVTVGGIIVIPRLISLLRTIGRVQAVERISTGSNRPAVGLRAALTGAALLPLGSSAHRFGELLAALGLTALIASTARIQARLNAAWARQSVTSSEPEPRIGTSPPGTRTNAGRSTPASRGIQDLLDRADQQRRNRVAREQARSS